jgi:hypothetical protein
MGNVNSKPVQRPPMDRDYLRWIFLHSLTDIGYEVERRRLYNDYLCVRKTEEKTLENSWIDRDRRIVWEAVLDGRPMGDKNSPSVGLRTIGGHPDREYYLELFDHENFVVFRVRLWAGTEPFPKTSHYFEQNIL